jgi:hypothetical protein
MLSARQMPCTEEMLDPGSVEQLAADPIDRKKAPRQSGARAMRSADIFLACIPEPVTIFGRPTIKFLFRLEGWPRRREVDHDLPALIEFGGKCSVNLINQSLKYPHAQLLLRRHDITGVRGAGAVIPDP